MKSPVIRNYEKDGVPVAVIKEPDKNNNIVIWSVRWDGSKPGKRAVSSYLSHWPSVKQLFKSRASLNPEVTQSACGGFI